MVCPYSPYSKPASIVIMIDDPDILEALGQRGDTITLRYSIKRLVDDFMAIGGWDDEGMLRLVLAWESAAKRFRADYEKGKQLAATAESK
jgi:hypothetical protein